ncbi:MAG TPA: isochorismatase family protein [Xanthobacteraceae bacterium]|jgi:nicotinamidase-related amidase
MTRLKKLAVGAAAIVGLLSTVSAGAHAQTVIEEWSTAKLPAPPALKPATIVPNETALLVMDFTKQTCTNERRPRCARSVAKVLNLVTQARGKGAFIVYSVAVPGSVPSDILPELTPAAGEPVLPPLGPDKFIASDLEKTLKDKGIKAVVAMGTQAQTSVLHTAGAAALRGFKVIVPVDGMSADDVFPELYTAWHLATAARISPQVTLTNFDLIGF